MARIVGIAEAHEMGKYPKLLEPAELEALGYHFAYDALVNPRTGRYHTGVIPDTQTTLHYQHLNKLERV